MELYESKVIKIGNSYGKTIPTELLREVGLAQGDGVQVEVKDGKIVLRKKEQISLPEGVDAEFMDILNDVIKEHDFTVDVVNHKYTFDEIVSIIETHTERL